MNKLMITLIVLMLTHFAQAAVWVNENQWSPGWEQKYHEWVKARANATMFSSEKMPNGQPNPYYGIRVDCADTVYSLRILFSFENKLPFAMTNPVNPDGNIITNQLTRYDKFEEGVPRLRQFLIWVYDLVSTHSLPSDTYSVGFKDVGPGTIILTSKKNHHSWTITNISKTGNPTLIFNSTVGRESGFDIQVRQSWPNPFWIFEPEVDPNDETKNIPIYLPGSYAGFRYWRPIEYLKMAENSVPGYNEEQYFVGVGKWKASAQATLAKVKETIDQVVLRLLKDACSDFKQRVEAVEEAEAYKENLSADFAAGKSEDDSQYIKEFMSDSDHPADKRCMIAKAFDQFSTPSRDKRLIDSIILARAYFSFGINKLGVQSFTPKSLSLFKTLFPLIHLSASEEAKNDQVVEKSNFCSLIVPDLGTLNLAEYKRRVFAGRFSSNPNDSYSARFGYPQSDKDLARVCPEYGLTKKPYDLDQIEQEMMREVVSSPVAQ